MTGELNKASTININNNPKLAPLHFGLAGRHDPLTPFEGLEIIDENLQKIYRQDGAPDAWQLKVYDVSHLESAAMREDIFQFFKKWL